MTSTAETIIEQLLKALSWEGKNIKRLRQGGLEYENVLTAIAIQGLDFLPRQHFLGAVVRGLEGSIEPVRGKLLEQIETVNISLLSGAYYLAPSQQLGNVQPDAVIESNQLFVLIEAKRAQRRSKFQREQLAREFVLVSQAAHRGRQPLLMLILGDPPPVKVDGLGMVSIEDAILAKLEPVLEQTEVPPGSLSELAAKIETTVAWTTWQEIARTLKAQLVSFETEAVSNRTAVERLSRSVIGAIERHYHLFG